MIEVGAKYTLDVDDFMTKMEKVGRTFTDFDERLKASAQRNPLAKFTTAQQGFNVALGQQVQVYQHVQAMENALVAVRKKTEQQLVDLKAKQDLFTAAGKYADYKKQIDLCEKALERLANPIKDAGTEFDKLKDKASKGIPTPTTKPAAAKSSSSGSSLKSAGLDVVDQLAGNAGINLSGGTLSAGAAVAAVTATIIKATDQWSKYGKALSEVSALTGATGKDLQFLDEKAKEIESDTGIAAIEVVNAFKSIGGIRPELLENNELLAATTKEVITLSQASGEGLEDTAKALLGSLSQFGEGAEEAARFSNVLAAGAKLGNSEIQDTSEALKVSGTAAKAAGLSFEQANAFLQILAKGMIKGGEAGTAMRNVLLKLETDTDKNLRPSVVGLEAALDNAAKKYSTTSQQAKVFGTENIVAAKQVFAARGEIAKMTESLTGTSVAYEQAKTNTDNLATDLKKTGTEINALFRNLGQSQDGLIRRSIQLVNEFLSSLNSKKGAFAAAWSEIFSGKSLTDLSNLNPFNITQRAIEAGLNQADANKADEAQKAAKVKLVNDAVDSVKKETEEKVKAYQEQGKTVPAAKRAAFEAEQKEADKHYYDLVAAHKRIKDESVLANAYDASASQATVDKYHKLFAESNNRIIAATAAKKQADKQLAQLNKDDANQKENLAKLLNEPLTDAQKKANAKALSDKNESNRLLLDAQKDYQAEAQKLELQFGKEKLEALNKDGSEYINAQAELAQEELKIQRDAIEKKLQLAKSDKTAVVNGKRQVVANTSVTLDNSAPALASMFAAQQQQIEDKRSRDLELGRVRSEYKLIELARQSNETELQLFDKGWEEKLLIEKKNAQQFLDYQQQYAEARPKVVGSFSEKELADFDAAWKKLIASEESNAAVYKAMIAKRDRDRNTLVVGQILNQTNDQETASTAFVGQDRFIQELRATKANSIGIINVEAEKQKAILKIQIDATEKKLTLLKEAGQKENSVVIAQTQATLDGLKNQQKTFNSTDYSSGAGYFGSLLGLGGQDLQKFKDGLAAIGTAIQESTSLAIQANEARISEIQSEISAKQEQVTTEEQRNKEGYANNLELRQRELQDLKAQLAAEQAEKRKNAKIQQELDLATSASNSVASASYLISASAKAFDKSIESSFNPIVGVVLAVAAIATIFATILSVKSKAKALTQLRSGGRLDGPNHEQGGIRGTGRFSDIEVEGGEHVVNARSSERYNKTLEAINKNNPEHALQMLIRESSISLPKLVIEHIQKPNFNVPVQQSGFSEKQMRDLITAVRENGEVAKEHAKIAKEHSRKTPNKEITRIAEGIYTEQSGDNVSIQDKRKQLGIK